MATEIKGIFKDDLHDKILQSKLLVVGAGGIGCEILKNLVMSGFKDIEIIDLDTIDVSNLNRQFLFHKEHVGKSKAEVAKESALSFNPNVEIKAFHDSITSTDYGVNYFQKFTLVLNALDNQAARNHVNRMCLTANIPLIESGTAGYNGQVELIKKGLTQCYECTPKAAQKSFPGCTIRNTPSEPIHCIVWAKHLFNQLFGEDNPDDDVSPDTADPEAAGDAGTDALSAESNEQGNVDRVNTKQWAQGCDYHPEKLFNKFFHDDIKYLLSMSNLWKTRKPPNPLKYGELHVITPEQNDHPPLSGGVMRDQKVWDIEESTKVFEDSLAVLKERASQLKENDHLVWDKDDKESMDFVAACANIRATIFSIATKSRFEIKSMAGNIIPAIATTNAITAGIVVLHAFKVLQEKFNKCQSVYMRLRPNARNQLFVPDKDLNAPNPKCYVCAAKHEVVLKVDTNHVTVKELRDEILIKNLNMVNPDVMLDGKGVIVLSSEEGETECNEPKFLKDLSIVDGCILKVDDFFQNYELTVTVLHINPKHDGPRYEIIADIEVIKPTEKKEEPQPGTSGISNGKSNGTSAPQEYMDEDDDLICVEVVDSNSNSRDIVCTDDADTQNEAQNAIAEKRKLVDSEDGSPNKKRARIQEQEQEIDDDDDVVCID